MLEELKDKASGLMENENVKEVVEKVTEMFTPGEDGKTIIDTVKEKAQDIFTNDDGTTIIDTVKEKAGEFIHDKFGK